MNTHPAAVRAATDLFREAKQKHPHTNRELAERDAMAAIIHAEFVPILEAAEALAEAMDEIVLNTMEDGMPYNLTTAGSLNEEAKAALADFRKATGGKK